MGVLDDMLDDAGGQPRPSSTFGDVVARAVGSRSAAMAADHGPPSLDPLLALDDGTLRRLIRYLPSDAMVPLLARASVPVAQRLVGLLDAESQSWLASQSEAIESCTAQAHAKAAQQALALIAKAQGAGPVAAAPAAPPVRRPVEVSSSFTTPVATTEEPIDEPAAATDPAPAETDDVVETLAALVALATGRNAQQMLQLADAVDHPVLAEGLRAIAAGADGHALSETGRIAGQRWLEDQARRVELMRIALLAIRFGDGPERFRRSAAQAS